MINDHDTHFRNKFTQYWQLKILVKLGCSSARLFVRSNRSSIRHGDHITIRDPATFSDFQHFLLTMLLLSIDADVYWCWLMLFDADWYSLVLIDADWLWLMLIDSDWCWFILIDSDWCWWFWFHWSWYWPLAVTQRVTHVHRSSDCNFFTHPIEKQFRDPDPDHSCELCILVVGYYIVQPRYGYMDIWTLSDCQWFLVWEAGNA